MGEFSPRPREIPRAVALARRVGLICSTKTADGDLRTTTRRQVSCSHIRQMLPIDTGMGRPTLNICAIEAPVLAPLPDGVLRPQADATPSAVVFDRVSFAFDDHVVLRDVSFSVPKGSMRILMGPSGAGKSVVLKLILGLLQPDSGSILVNDRHIKNMTEQDLMDVRADIGMMFQENALFDSLTVAENVGYRLYEETDMPLDQVRRHVEEVLGFVGLKDYVDTVPSELSGGQRRRVAVARAMAAKPSLLLFDDPTSGLDPITAATIDDQILKLRDLEHVTSIVVTHQMRDAFYVASHDAAGCDRPSRFELPPRSGRACQIHGAPRWAYLVRRDRGGAAGVEDFVCGRSSLRRCRPGDVRDHDGCCEEHARRLRRRRRSGDGKQIGRGFSSRDRTPA